MRILIASDSFKGSLSSEKAAALMARAAREVFGDCETVCLPVADGGEGTVDALVSALGGRRVRVNAHGPLMEPLQAEYGLLPGESAVIEMAAAAGLPLVPPPLRDPRRTTTFGVGEMLRDALDRGCRNLYMGIGGSATNDGGMGFLRALGARFFDGPGRELSGLGGDLSSVSRMDLSGLDPRLAGARITVLCDVSNPLCGPDGAAYVFAGQKGASPAVQDELEAGMRRFCGVIERELGVSCENTPGAGAAGGLGAALLAFCGAGMRSGIDTVLDLLQFDAYLERADLVITGEGRADSQTRRGKVMQGVARRAGKHGVPAVGLCGSLAPGALDLCRDGLSSLMAAVSEPVTLEEAMAGAEAMYLDAARRMLRFLRTGMDMARRASG